MGPGVVPGVMLPPPPGPPPNGAMGQQMSWHGGFGRGYDGRSTFTIPPPPPGQHQPYNPQLHARVAGQTIPLQLPRNDGISATYIPSGNDPFGEGVGIPGLGHEILTPQSSWPIQTPVSGTDTAATTPMDDLNVRDRSYPGSAAQARTTSSASNAPTSNIAPETAAQWSLDRVLIWLAKNQFSKDWQETFKALNIHGAQFLELGSGVNGRGSAGMMHRRVYPRLEEECNFSGTGFDLPREREEGKRMRRLIRSVLSSRSVEPPFIGSHSKKESWGHAQSANLPSAGTDPGDSPNVGDDPLLSVFCLSKLY